MKYFDGKVPDEGPPCRLGSRCLCVGLPPRQRQVLHGLLSAEKERAAMLRRRLNPDTAHIHVKVVYKRFSVNSRVELMLAAIDKATSAGRDEAVESGGRPAAGVEARAWALLDSTLKARSRLGPRHREVLRGFLSPASEKQLARSTGTSRHAVHQRGKAVYRYFGVKGRVALLSLLLDHVAGADGHRSSNVVRSSIAT